MFIDAVSNQSARVVSLQSKAELLLISQDDSLHREITRSELEGLCHQIGGRFVCENLGVFYRHLASSCLGSLFGRLSAAALSSCDMHPIREQWLVIPVKPDTVVLFSKQGRGADVICDNGTRLAIMATGITDIHLEEGCALTTGDHYIRRSKETTIRMHVRNQPAWDAEDLEAAWQRTTGAILNRTRATEEKLESLARRPIGGDPADLAWLDQQADPTTAEGRLLLRGLLAATVGFAVTLAGLIAFLVWRFCRTPAKRVRKTTPENP